jgi:formate dehydrogenase iron-sulfur subunit
MQKCTFCPDRVSKGQWTACAEACPTGALTFGNRGELITNGEQRVTELKKALPNTTLYVEKELGGLHVLYILTDLPEIFKFPADLRYRAWLLPGRMSFSHWVGRSVD